jgi:AcrR family transcriptional regulator
MRTKTDERKQLILTTAAAAFTELGVENTTMSELVARLGGSKSTIYSYFASKAELVSAVMGHATESLLQQAFNDLDPRQPLALALDEFGNAYLRHLLTPEMVSIIRIAQQHGKRDDNARLYYENGSQTGWNVMAEHLDLRKTSRELRDVDTFIAAIHLKGLLQAEHLERAMLGYFPTSREIAAAAQRAVEVFLRAYAEGAAGPHP